MAMDNVLQRMQQAICLGELIRLLLHFYYKLKYNQGSGNITN